MSTVVHGTPVPEADQDCARCRRRTITPYIWRRATQQQRDAWKAANVVRRDGRGLCQSCYRWARLHDRLPDFERVNQRTGDVLEEWEHLANPHRPVKAEIRRLAPQLGMKEKTLEQALLRAGVRSRFEPGHGERLRAS